MAIKLGTNNIVLPYSKAYLGANLVYQKITEVLHTDNPIPTSWSQQGSSNTYTNGDWEISSSLSYSTLNTVTRVFDRSTSTSNSSRSGYYVYLTPPTNIKITKMKIYTSRSTTSTYIDCVLQVSTNGSTWNNLMTIGTTNSLGEFVLPSSDYGYNYRLYLTVQSGKGSALVTEWQISEYYTNS